MRRRADHEYKNASGRAFLCCFLLVSGLLENIAASEWLPVTQFTILRGLNQPFLPTPTMLGVVIMQAFHHVTGRVDRRAYGCAPESDAELVSFSY